MLCLCYFLLRSLLSIPGCRLDQFLVTPVNLISECTYITGSTLSCSTWCATGGLEWGIWTAYERGICSRHCVIAVHGGLQSTDFPKLAMNSQLCSIPIIPTHLYQLDGGHFYIISPPWLHLRHHSAEKHHNLPPANITGTDCEPLLQGPRMAPL